MSDRNTPAAATPRQESGSAGFYDTLSAFIRVYQFRDRNRIICHGISVTQCYALEAVVRDGPLTLNELAGHLFLDKSTASRVVGSLRTKGLIDRKVDPGDRRAARLTATETGRQLHSRVRRDIEQRDRKLLADFTPEVRSGMLELLERLTRAAEERVRTAGGSCCSIDE